MIRSVFPVLVLLLFAMPCFAAAGFAIAIHAGTGTPDDTSGLHPVAHAWTQGAQPWFGLDGGAQTLEQQPEIGELLELWQARAADGSTAGQ